jgi:hypothetical protein
MSWEFAGLWLNIVKAYIDFEIGARKALSKEDSGGILGIGLVISV